MGMYHPTQSSNTLNFGDDFSDSENVSNAVLIVCGMRLILPWWVTYVR